MAPHAAQRIDIGDGDLVEVARDDGPSLLGWAELDADIPDDTCAIVASTASLLGLAHDDRIAVRRVNAPPR